MCGIAGFTTYSQRTDNAQDLLRAMAVPLQARGPDGEGYLVDGAIALAHRRLSIIDVAGGAQPMSTEDGRYHLIFNGEIYNYIELREELRALGHSFGTQSDTEVLLKTIAHWGIDGLNRLNGMFAFALWDKRESALYLARDRIGIKPLYYAFNENDVVFASELKSLRVHPHISRSLNPLSVSKYFTFGFIPAPHTIFEGIHKLEPGTYLRINESGSEKVQYWDIPIEPVSGRNIDDCAVEFLELLEDSVKKRLRSDVPLGVFLSGGIDSSAIVALAARSIPGRLHTFSVGFEEASYDESPYARLVAEQYNTEHHHEILSLSRAVKMLPDVMSILDEPFGDASILPTYLLSQFTSSHVKVCLGGDGGDELMAGYPSFAAHKITERLSFLPIATRDRIVRLARKIPVSHRYASMEFLLQQFFKGAGISPEIRFFLWMGYYGNDQKRQLLSSDVKQQILRENPFEDVLNYVRQSLLVNDFERILYLCMKLYLQDDILVKVDRASMAHSLEVRVPFLDHNLVEYASGILPAYKLKGLTSKYLLKIAVRDLLPKKIIHRRKAGFMIPIAKWIQGDLRDMIEDLCSQQALEETGLFDAGYARSLIESHYRGDRDHRKLIWSLLAFMVWHRNNNIAA